ncbi:MAG: hypothetical protein PUP92_00995 [Rhizonema sp. PD38]|nr:hypothetical protein [Rhizonema sp. PD38]
MKPLTKKAFLLEFGGSIGLFMISCGAMMESDRSSQLELDLANSRLDKQRELTENHRCKTCKYYSGRAELLCCVHPTTVLIDDRWFLSRMVLF